MQRLRIAAAAAVVCLAATALGAEREIQREDLPIAVQRAVDRESVGAHVRRLSMETEEGSTDYEAELTVGGRAKDVLFDREGNVIEVEEEVALESLPETVRLGLATQAGKGKILHVESVVRSGQLFAYEAVVRTGAKRFEVSVGALGQPLSSTP